MRFWDTSAIAPLFLVQQASARLRELYLQDKEVVVWDLTDVELRSALARVRREAGITAAEVQELGRRIDRFWETVEIVPSSDRVKTRAKRLLNVHTLKAADALQLAAALAASEDDPTRYELVCLDQRLSDAASLEGYAVLP